MKDMIIIISPGIPAESTGIKDDYFLKKELTAREFNKPDLIFQSIAGCQFQKGV